MEIPFFLDATALLCLEPGTLADEDGLLKTFDLQRATIEKAATRVYTRHHRGTYILTASDFV